MHKRLHGLDHLRAFAICFVFLYHYQIFEHPEWLPNIAKFGWTGVDLFFVLSGFLISSQLFFQIKNGVKISFKDFFLKRFFRILPLFWFVTGVYFLIPLFREREALPPLWKFLTFTQNLALNLQDFGTFSHAWSLCVEEHFYFVLPIVLIFLQRCKQFYNAYWVLILLFSLGLLVRLYSWEILYLPHIDNENAWLFWLKYIYYPTYNRLDGLLIGVSIAAVYQFLPSVWSRISKFGNYFLIVSIIILIAAYFLCYEEHSFYASIFGFTAVSVGYGFMVIGAISPSSFLYQYHSKVTTFIAMLSYGIYLIHKGIIHITQGLLPYFEIDANSSLSLIICIISCIIIAFILHQVIEKPFMELRKKWVP